MRRQASLTVACCAVAVAQLFAEPLRIDVKEGESLVAVRDKVRAMSADEKKGGVEVVLAPGEYVLPGGLEFAEADGGASAAAPIVWRSAEKGAARISGAARIPPSSFAKVEDADLLARLPEEGRGKVYAADVSALCPDKVPQLGKSGKLRPPFVFLDGRLATLAKYPNGAGWLGFKKRVDRGTPMGKKKDSFFGGAFVCVNPRFERWDFSKGVWLNGYFTHDWYNCSVQAASYGTENGTNGVMRISAEARVPYGIMSGTWGRKTRRFRAFNLFEELDEPGEWWLDRDKKILYVVPPDGKMTDSVDIRLVFSEDTLVHGKNLANLHFEGIDFSFSCGNLASFALVTNVAFRDCRFIGTTKGGLALSGTGNLASRCEVAQCGAGGISVSGGDRKTLTPSGSVVENCRIHDFGILQRTYASGASVHGCGIVLRGCEIFNAPHQAVGFGGNELLLESNNVHHVVMETGDAGAFYTGRNWTTQGNILRGNFVHDIGKGTTDREGKDAAVSGTNAMGMYFDDCDCGDEIIGNVFMNCPRGIMIGGGRDHPVKDNVFIGCNLGLSIDCRGIKWKTKWNVPGGSWHLEGKAEQMNYKSGVWAERYPRLANIMNDHPREPLYNPVEDNVFIDCKEILRISAAIKCNDDGTAPGLLSRMAPIRGNRVVYTKGADKVPRQEFDPRIAPGFLVLEAVK